MVVDYACDTSRRIVVYKNVDLNLEYMVGEKVVHDEFGGEH